MAKTIKNISECRKLIRKVNEASGELRGSKKEIKEIKTFLDKVFNELDIDYSISNNGSEGYLIEAEYYSDLGEDVIISLVFDNLDKDEIMHEMYNYWQNFDPEEHAAEWFRMNGEYGAPTNLRALLQDADEQAEMLEKVYDTMRKYK